MPTQEVLASPATRRDRADQEFRGLFTAYFPPLAHAVHTIVGDRAAAEEITCAAFLRLHTHWRRVTRSERPDEWVHREALQAAERMVAEAPRTSRSDDGIGDHWAALAGWEERAEVAYAAVAAAARRRTVRRRSTVAGAAAVVALVAGVVLMPDPGPPAPEPPPQHLSQTLPVGPPPWATERVDRPPESPLPRAALDGHWWTAPLTRAEVAGALRVAGLAEYADYAETFPTGRFRIQLSVSAERSVLTVEGDQRSIGILRVAGHRVTLEPLPPNLGFSHFRWSRVGRQVSLVFTGSSMAKHSGYPAEVHQVALYATAPFTRY